MLLDDRFVERIDFCRFGFPLGNSDFIGNLFYLFEVASSQEDRGTLAGKSASNSTANRPTCPLDHRMFVQK